MQVTLSSFLLDDVFLLTSGPEWPFAGRLFAGRRAVLRFSCKDRKRLYADRPEDGLSNTKWL
jgi:hypothetical protein